jgi:hypothetical protein
MQRSLAWLVTLALVTITSPLCSQPIEVAIGGGYDFGRSSLQFDMADSTTLWLQSFCGGIAAPSVCAQVSMPIDSGLRLCVRLSAYRNSTRLAAPLHEVEIMFPEPPTFSIEERIYFTSSQFTGEFSVRSTWQEDFRSPWGQRSATGSLRITGICGISTISARIPVPLPVGNE